MNTSPALIFLNTLARSPFRFVSILSVGALGAMIPIGYSVGWNLSEMTQLFLMIPLLPLYLLYLSIFAGWWFFIAIPLIILQTMKIYYFVKDNSSAYDVLQVFLCGFIVTSPYLLGIRWIALSIAGPLLLYGYEPFRYWITIKTTGVPKYLKPWVEQVMAVDLNTLAVLDGADHNLTKYVLETHRWKLTEYCWLLECKLYRYVKEETDLVLIAYNQGHVALSASPDSLAGLLPAIQQKVAQIGVAEKRDDIVRVIEIR